MQGQQDQLVSGILIEPIDLSRDLQKLKDARFECNCGLIEEKIFTKRQIEGTVNEELKDPPKKGQ